MISVCIPVFNTDVRKLACQLAEEAEEVPFPVEILIFDDGSAEGCKQVNREIAGMAGIRYHEMPVNTGRSAIRNNLGNEAAYPWILFLDGDSEIPGMGFLNRYAGLTENAAVICGGTIYRDTSPGDKTKRLRWVYGRKREQLSARQRSAGNKFAITSNNFMIRHDVFNQYRFREIIREYGHEDTLLGYDLHIAGIPVVHADNPVIHTGLETSAEFILKTENALENLLSLSENIIKDKKFNRGLKLLKWRNRLKRSGGLSLAALLFRSAKHLLVKNLTGEKPCLFLFDLYRLGSLCNKSLKAG